jgi:hypothetical protein
LVWPLRGTWLHRATARSAGSTTKGVNNETPFSDVQYLHPINEDVDSEKYEFGEGELRKMDSNWKGDDRPETTYTMKSEDNHVQSQFLSSTASPDTTPSPSAPVSAQISGAVTDVPSDNESKIEESECSFPQPPESGDERRFTGGFPARAAEPEPVIPAKPARGHAWSRLKQESTPGNAYLVYSALCPAQDMEEVLREVMAIDQYSQF